MTEKSRLSRRQFLKIAGIGTAATVLTCTGATQIYQAVSQPSVEFIETSSEGAAAMNNKVLIAYASKAGSTSEVAEAMAEVLRAKGSQVDVKQIKNVSDLGSYQAVILGSCIRMGSWLPEAADFVKKHKAELGKMPTAYFVMNATLREDTPENRKTVLAYLDPVRAEFEPGKIGLFAGKMDLNKLSFIDRMISKMVGSVEGDFRDWNAIRAWAAEALPAA